MQRKFIYSGLTCLLGLTLYLHGSNYTKHAIRNRVLLTSSSISDAIPIYSPETFSENLIAVQQPAPEDGGCAMGSTTWFLYLGISICLTLFGGLCSGLTVGMLGVEQQDLELQYKNFQHSKIAEMKKKSDDAYRLLNVLRDHHLLLATLLLSNAAAMEALPLFLDDLVPSWLAIILSVTVVLIFGEIIPQAVCTGENQIKIACKMIPVVKVLIIVLFPICKPIGLVLDCVLGKHQKKRYKTDSFRELIKLHYKKKNSGDISRKVSGDVADDHKADDQLKTAENENIEYATHIKDGKMYTSTEKKVEAIKDHHEGMNFQEDEIGILLSTFDLRHNTATDPDVQIPLNKMFSCNDSDVINKDFVDLIKRKNYTRFPIKSQQNGGFLGIMGVKRLITVDLAMPSRAISDHIDNQELFLTKIKYVAKDTKLITILRIFQMYKTSIVMIVNKTKEEYLAKLTKQKTWSKKFEKNLEKYSKKADITQTQIDLHHQLYLETKQNVIHPKEFNHFNDEGEIQGMIHIKDVFEKLCDIGEFEDDDDGISMLANFMMKSTSRPKKQFKRASTQR